MPAGLDETRDGAGGVLVQEIGLDRVLPQGSAAPHTRPVPGQACNTQVWKQISWYVLSITQRLADCRAILLGSDYVSQNSVVVPFNDAH